MILDKYKKRANMTNEEKALEKDYQIYCEMTGDLPNKELNRRYKKYYLMNENSR